MLQVGVLGLFGLCTGVDVKQASFNGCLGAPDCKEGFADLEILDDESLLQVSRTHFSAEAVPSEMLQHNATGARRSFSTRSGSSTNIDGIGKKSNIFCIGDSITLGVLATSAEKSYPAQLQELLGPSFQVFNFGDRGATVQKEITWYTSPEYNFHSIWGSDIFKKALEQVEYADGVVIMLGSNDATGYNQPNLNRTDYLMTFQSDYIEFVRIFQTIPSQPKVYLMVPPPMYNYSKIAMITLNQTFINTVLPIEVPHLSQITGADIAANLFLEFIERCPLSSTEICNLMLHTPLQAVDGVHPGDEGYKFIADLVFKKMREDFLTTG